MFVVHARKRAEKKQGESTKKPADTSASLFPCHTKWVAPVLSKSRVDCAAGGTGRVINLKTKGKGGIPRAIESHPTSCGFPLTQKSDSLSSVADRADHWPAPT
ncbi:hypothetical protein BRCON_2664 [Candidatus Sumerlaea chitinivorans]|uniref:Uncharacterized protein n=1 Tax=Sumerlaea chitinivorans TaxID=2250252 RepID=A0A2Z4Y8P8_SUMC1|nr:hypothetical protein BRCON_2664 [Candidatus Sumerlaea chitinivorans]